MKQYKVTVFSEILNEDRTVEVQAANAQDAHKETMFSEGFDLSFDKVTEIRTESGLLVYGDQGFVNSRRDQQESEATC